MYENQYKRTLTIAGSDSGGGAGIQADLKTFSALGCYGMSVIAALTAQNTSTVTGILEIEHSFVEKQIDAVLSDIGTDAVKIGMLSDPMIIKTVARKLKEYKIENVVLDPVMVAKSGDKLLKDESIETLKKELIPIAKIITPNIPEAEVLTGIKINDYTDLLHAADILFRLGPESVLVKGGHLEGETSNDVLLIKSENEGNPLEFQYESKRIDSVNTHGTGCTLSSAIASFLARGFSLQDSVKNAKEYITEAILEGANYKLGNGHGPVHHFHKFWK